MPTAIRTLDLRSLFNPVDCRSIGVIRDALGEIAPGAVLEVICNRFQEREIAAWCRKFSHPILERQDEEGRVRLWIQRRPA